MASVRVPDFFVIGAARSGTTSLYRYLCEHPDMFMSPMKDTNFLCADAEWSRWFKYVTPSLDEYSALFAAASAEKVVGESSVSYLPHPPVADRIRSLVPNARLIAILREPAERAYSDFVWLRARGLRHPRSFREVVDAEIEGAPDAMHFVRSGFYREHLSLSSVLRPIAAPRLSLRGPRLGHGERRPRHVRNSSMSIRPSYRIFASTTERGTHLGSTALPAPSNEIRW